MITSNESSLIGMDGRPRFGIYSRPLTCLNLDDFRPYGTKDVASSVKGWILKYRIKQWQYLGLCSNDIIFGIAVVRIGYMCNMFAYLFDRRSTRISEYNIVTLGGGAAIFEGTSLAGVITFQSGKMVVRMTNSPETITLDGSIKEELSFNLSFRKHEEPMVCLTRVGMKGFNYTHKESGIAIRGVIRHQGASWNIQEEQSFGVLDFTLGYLARHTYWNWASGGGISKEGKRIGFNLAQGINETGFTENVFWINGRLVKTDVVDFRHDDLDIMKPWRIESNDGRVRLQFLPQGKRTGDTRLGLIESIIHQPFGRFEGTLRDGDQVYESQNVSGFTEEHYAKW